jgi:tetratricopeptide (TPR) repeat protein
VELAERATDPDARYWLGPLLNNLGWACFAAGQYEEALAAFQGALRARERDPRQRTEIEIARYALAKTLRVLGRPAAAAALLEEAVAWTRTVGEPDGWFHEELAEAYAALGREADARQQARLALPLLKVADASFKDDTERASRLRALAGQAQPQLHFEDLPHSRIDEVLGDGAGLEYFGQVRIGRIGDRHLHVDARGDGAGAGTGMTTDMTTDLTNV